jgi:D-glycero-alpha-D-manno-heptose-7-phosphate kinase
MIIVRAPLRITLGGGGTDLPDWYRQHGGFFVSASINKYIYLTGSRRPFDNKIWLSYSQTEVCENTSEIKHSFLQKCIERYNLKSGIEIHTVSEVPGNSGLGSSGAFLVGCLTLLNSMDKVEMTRQTLAELACRIEMVELARASGKQDQYISAIGGIAAFTINEDGRVTIEQMNLPSSTVRRLENNLLIYYTGVARDSNAILAEQNKAFEQKAMDKVTAMKEIQSIGYKSRDAIVSGDLDEFGRLMHQHWVTKKKMSNKMSDPMLDAVYDHAMTIGALGGKIMGAGGGGYWMFYVPAEKQLEFRRRAEERGMVEMDWRFDSNGCSVVYSN